MFEARRKIVALRKCFGDAHVVTCYQTASSVVEQRPKRSKAAGSNPASFTIRHTHEELSPNQKHDVFLKLPEHDQHRVPDSYARCGCGYTNPPADGLIRPIIPTIPHRPVVRNVRNTTLHRVPKPFATQLWLHDGAQASYTGSNPVIGAIRCGGTGRRNRLRGRSIPKGLGSTTNCRE